MAVPAVAAVPAVRVGPAVPVAATDSMLLVVVSAVTVADGGLPVVVRPVWLGRWRCVLVVLVVLAATVVTPVVPAMAGSAVLRPRRRVGRRVLAAVRVMPTVALPVVLVVLVALGLTLRG